MAIRYKVTKGRRSYPGEIDPLYYSKGGKVIPRSKLGIFLFERRKDAKDYVAFILGRHPATMIPEDLQILRVETIGKGRKLTICPNKEQNHRGFKIKDVLRSSRKSGYIDMPLVGSNDCFNDLTIWYCAPGTMIYPGVKVLT